MIALEIDDRERKIKLWRVLDEDVVALVDRHWEDSDQLLKGLQSHPLFDGYMFWCDLTPTLLRILVAENLAVFLLDPDDADAGRSLDFLVGVLARKLQEVTGAEIAAMSIERHSHTDIRYDIKLTSKLDLPKPKVPHLRLVVDNTKK